MLNAEMVLSVAKRFVNARGEISQEKLADLLFGLTEEEGEEVLGILRDHNISVVEEEELEVPDLGRNYKKLQGLTNEQLCVQAQDGDKTAMAALVEKNSRLVSKIAYQVMRDYRPESSTVEDLETAGKIGLIETINKFEVGLGYKFSTYAFCWIKQKITRDVMDRGYMIRIPVHKFEEIILVNKARKAIRSSSPAKIREILQRDYGKDFTEEKISEVITCGDKYLNTVSLNREVGDEGDGDMELGDLLPSDINVEDEVMGNIARELIDEALDTLKEREAEVIRMRYGLSGHDRMTLEEVGETFHVTRERIRQIEAKALKKLAMPQRSRRLEGLLVA